MHQFRAFIKQKSRGACEAPYYGACAAPSPGAIRSIFLTIKDFTNNLFEIRVKNPFGERVQLVGNFNLKI